MNNDNILYFCGQGIQDTNKICLKCGFYYGILLEHEFDNIRLCLAKRRSKRNHWDHIKLNVPCFRLLQSISPNSHINNNNVSTIQHFKTGNESGKSTT